MFELSACIALLFGEDERPMPDRVRVAAAAGCTGVDLWGWRKLDLEALSTAVGDCDMSVRMMLVDPISHLVDPARQAEFVAAVDESAQAAVRIGCRALVVLPGESRPGVSQADQDAAIVAGLGAAAPSCAEVGVELLLEPLNTRGDHPGMYLSDTRRALDLVEAVDQPGVGILYDIYHSAMMGEAVVDVIADRAELVRHVHVADTEGRHEPGTGTLDWPDLLHKLRATGYRGFLGLEYVPTVASGRSMDPLRAMLAGMAAS